MSMEKKETSPAGLRRSFPPPIYSLLVSVSCFSCGGSPFEKHRGTLYIGVFRSRGYFRAKDRRKRGHEGQNRWATWLQYQAAWGTPFCHSGLCSLASFAPRSFSFQNNDPRKFAAHYDVVKVLKQIRKEIGVFCLRKINSIKRGNQY